MNIRPAAVAGQFYPARPEVLRETVEHLLTKAEARPAPDAAVAVLAPHAGYPYSGATAAEAFQVVRGKQCRRVILFGRSHHFRFDGASIWERGAWETPLGRLPVDEAFAGELAKRLGNFGERPHLPEHGLEVELPFLQVALGETKLVPVLFGADPVAWHVEAGRTVAELMGEDDLPLLPLLHGGDGHTVLVHQQRLKMPDIRSCRRCRRLLHLLKPADLPRPRKTRKKGEPTRPHACAQKFSSGKNHGPIMDQMTSILVAEAVEK